MIMYYFVTQNVSKWELANNSQSSLSLDKLMLKIVIKGRNLGKIVSALFTFLNASG